MTTATSTQTSRFDLRSYYINNVYFKDGLVFTTILCSLLYLVLAVSLDAAGHVTEGLGILIPVTLGALAVGILMSFSRFDTFFAFSHSMFAGLAWILFLMSRNVTGKELEPILSWNLAETQARAYFVLVQLINWLDAAVKDKVNADNHVFVFEISLLVWWLTYLGVWSILRHGYTWRAVIPAGVVLLLNTHYAPTKVYSFLLIFALLALILLIRTHLAELQLRWRDQYIYFSQDIGWDFMRNGVSYSIVALVLALLIPNLGRSQTMQALLAPISERWVQSQTELRRLYGGLNQRTELSASAFGQSLQLGGERQVGDSILFQAAASKAHYWRAVIFDTYDGKGWTDSSDLTYQAAANALIPAPEWANRELISQTITLLSPMGDLILGPPDIRSVSLPINAIVIGSPAPPTFGGEPVENTETGAIELSLTSTNRNLETGDSYVVTSNAVVVSEAELRAALGDYPPSITARYLQLPEKMSTRVITTAQEIITGLITPFDQAKAIETYLRTIPYNDAISAPPAGEDPLEYFLFDLRQGYCDYYATAMAIMLRTLGIPARAVSGYASGSFDDETGLYYITERDAHTWVEVFFPGLGWIEFEPTAGETLPYRPLTDESSTATLGNEPTTEPQAGDFEPTPQLSNPPALDQNELPLDGGVLAGQGNPLPWWLWLILTPLLLLGGLWVLWRLQMPGPSAFTPEFPPILYERLQRWAGRLRLAPPDSMTPYEQSTRLAQALPEVERPIQVVTDSYVHYRFAPQGAVNATPTGANADNPQQLADAWRNLLPVFWRRWLKQGVMGRTRTAKPVTPQPKRRKR